MIGLIFIELKFTPSPLAHCCDANGTTPSEENCQHYSIPFHFVVKKYQFRTAFKSRVVRRKCHLKDEDTHTFSLEFDLKSQLLLAFSTNLAFIQCHQSKGRNDSHQAHKQANKGKGACRRRDRNDSFISITNHLPHGHQRQQQAARGDFI